MSHHTRAYFDNAKGFKGFLVPSIMEILEQADKNGQLDEAKNLHRFDLDEIEKKTSTISDNKALMTFFEKHYPSLCIFLLYHFNQKDRVQ